ncbi:hypothetical protein I4641_17085 [Waterburya agarophytonicola K14]|uniref:Uncharacterized protein n=1 Tax=Waterburya agarophytonicola KI4 TaxID=2874699 RepID=A0A964BU01_9CYAN|nr:DUF6262 family protein [Waterburya agarophytonicola]MCC0178687.1 hypothetical protein [Waterburya agarophytonicola KI4]
MSNKQIAALTIASQQKQKIALARTEEAIEYLIENNFKITVRSVAKTAGVSVSYIYKYPELAYKIQTLRDRQKYNLDSEKCLPSNINQQLKKLKSEKIELIGKIEELNNYINAIEEKGKSLTKLQIENLQLQTENQQLKQELEYIKQNLHKTRSFILSQGYDTQDEVVMETRKRVVQKITSENTKVIKTIRKEFKKEI